MTSPSAKMVINDKTDETTSSNDVAMHNRKVTVSYFGCSPTISSRYEFGVTNALADKQARIAASIYVHYKAFHND